MTKEKHRAALEFLFATMGQPIGWRARVLTRDGNREGNPPDLNIVEAQSVVADLLNRGLIIKSGTLYGDDIYLIDQTKEDEWRELIAKTKEVGCFEKHRKKLLGVPIAGAIIWVLGIAAHKFIEKTTENILEPKHTAVSTNTSDLGSQLVKGLYDNMTNEVIAISNTNLVATYAQTNNFTLYLVKLGRVPIPGSVHVTVLANNGIVIPQQRIPESASAQNIVSFRHFGSPEVSDSLSFDYVVDATDRSAYQQLPSTNELHFTKDGFFIKLKH